MSAVEMCVKCGLRVAGTIAMCQCQNAEIERLTTQRDALLAYAKAEQSAVEFFMRTEPNKTYSLRHKLNRQREAALKLC